MNFLTRITPTRCSIEAGAPANQPTGVDGWGNGGKTNVTSEKMIDVCFGHMVGFSTNGTGITVRAEFSTPVLLGKLEIKGGSFAQVHPITLQDSAKKVLGTVTVHGSGNAYREATVDLLPPVTGAVFYIIEPPHNYVARSYVLWGQTSVRHSTLAKDVGLLYDNSELSDVSFVMENNSIHVNKAILAIRSKPLKAMLFGGMRESKESKINLPEDYQTMQHFFRYIYTDDIMTDLSPEMYLQVMAAAEKYAVEGLKELCGSHLVATINQDTVCTILLYAHQSKVGTLKEFCLEYIKKFKAQVAMKKSFAELKKDVDLLLEVTKFLAAN